MTASVGWNLYPARDRFASAVACDVERCITDAVAARGQAVLALSGGKTPVAILEYLATRPLPWEKVTLLPSDDRIVATTDGLSNAGMLARVFGGTGARVLPLVTEPLERREAGARADALLHDLPWPLDLVWLGMGGDGHTASIFPGPDLTAALAPAPGVRAVGVRPDPLPPEAPVHRVTLTAPAIAAARHCIVVMEGAHKRRVLEQALAEGAGSAFPIGPVLAQRADGVIVHCLDEH